MRDTIGKISTDLLLRVPETRSVIELERSAQKDYITELNKCFNDGLKKYPNNFFIEVATRSERLMPNVHRNQFFNRWTCPTPNYDQTVYRYNKFDDCLEYIWTIPSRDACIYLKDHALEVTKSERDLLNFVLQFADGSLLILAKKLNNEA